MKMFLPILAVLFCGTQSQAAKVKLEVRPSTYAVKFLSARTKPYYYKEVKIENCDPSIVFEGGSGCVEEVRVDEPVLEISYQTEDHEVENDPVEGSRIGKVTLLLKNMSELSSAAFLSNGSASLLEIFNTQAVVGLESESENATSCDVALEGGSDCPNPKVDGLMKSFLTIELN